MERGQDIAHQPESVRHTVYKSVPRVSGVGHKRVRAVVDRLKKVCSPVYRLLPCVFYSLKERRNPLADAIPVFIQHPACCYQQADSEDDGICQYGERQSVPCLSHHTDNTPNSTHADKGGSQLADGLEELHAGGFEPVYGLCKRLSVAFRKAEPLPEGVKLTSATLEVDNEVIYRKRESDN